MGSRLYSTLNTFLLNKNNFTPLFFSTNPVSLTPHTLLPHAPEHSSSVVVSYIYIEGYVSLSTLWQKPQQIVDMWLKCMHSLDLVENMERILENKIWPKRYLYCFHCGPVKKKVPELGVWNVSILDQNKHTAVKFVYKLCSTLKNMLSVYPCLSCLSKLRARAVDLFSPSCFLSFSHLATPVSINVSKCFCNFFFLAVHFNNLKKLQSLMTSLNKNAVERDSSLPDILLSFCTESSLIY